MIENVNEFYTICDVLNRRAKEMPDKDAFIILDKGEVIGDKITYSELEYCSKLIADKLKNQMNIKGPALLLFPTGLEYIVSLMACFYSQIIAVPTYPPSHSRHVERLIKIIDDSGADVILTNNKIHKIIMADREAYNFFQNKKWIIIDDINTIKNDKQEIKKEFKTNEESIAFLQYTSGSTGNPKGVVVTHKNLISNLSIIKKTTELSEKTITVSWLPLYHDMGLIGFVFELIFIGGTSVLMAPLYFLQKPFRWLKAISDFKADVSGAPNFAYDLCCDKITEEQKNQLNLSNWSVSYNAAEPIRKSSMDSFYKELRNSGLKKSVFMPAYGMAENTLLISNVKPMDEYTSLKVSSEDLKRDKVIVLNEDGNDNEIIEIINCGKPLDEIKVKVVNPATLIECKDNNVGEFWIQSDSVANGYWNNKEVTNEIFNANILDTNEGPFLRSGDLGFINNKNIYVTGRLKDLIIINGENYYSQDLEQIVEKNNKELVRNASAAFSVDIDGNEKVVHVAELHRTFKHGKSKVIGDENNLYVQIDKLKENIKKDIYVNLGLNVYDVILIKETTMNKTTSGKIRRNKCKEDYLSGNLIKWGD